MAHIGTAGAAAAFALAALAGAPAPAPDADPDSIYRCQDSIAISTGSLMGGLELDGKGTIRSKSIDLWDNRREAPVRVTGIWRSVFGEPIVVPDGLAEIHVRMRRRPRVIRMEIARMSGNPYEMRLSAPASYQTAWDRHDAYAVARWGDLAFFAQGRQQVRVKVTRERTGAAVFPKEYAQATIAAPFFDEVAAKIPLLTARLEEMRAEYRTRCERGMPADDDGL